MAACQEMVDAAPEFASVVRRHFDARQHKTIATIRQDGSPRISGIETFFADDHLWFGSMPADGWPYSGPAAPIRPRLTRTSSASTSPKRSGSASTTAATGW
jgi:hypothetical protein